eukprot:m.83395 g.83395  ORF g.83395 m.83395 type:complete len:461 (-) comp8688_c0_seq3:56-1438(-)
MMMVSSTLSPIFIYTAFALLICAQISCNVNHAFKFGKGSKMDYKFSLFATNLAMAECHASFCTRYKLAADATKSQTTFDMNGSAAIMLLVLSKEYIGEARRFLDRFEQAMRSSNERPFKPVLITTEEESAAWLKNSNYIDMVQHFPLILAELMPDHRLRGKIWRMRLMFSRYLLMKGIGLLVNDFDAMWLQNPLPYLRKMQATHAAHVVGQRGLSPFMISNVWGAIPVFGFVYVHPSLTSRILFSIAKDISFIMHKFDDQYALSVAMDVLASKDSIWGFKLKTRRDAVRKSLEKVFGKDWKQKSLLSEVVPVSILKGKFTKEEIVAKERHDRVLRESYRFQLIQKKCKVAYNVEFDSRENPELMESVGVFVNNIQLSSYDTPPINVVGWEKEDVISIRTMVHPTPEKTALLHTNLVLLPAHLFIRNCTDWSDFNNAIIKHCVSPHDTRLVDTPYEDDIII